MTHVESLTSIVPKRSHSFLLGTTVPAPVPLNEHLSQLITSGASPSEVEQAETKWIEDHQLMTFEDG